MTEVAAFTERREIIKVDTSGAAKIRLLASLRFAIESSVTDVTLKPATELLEELAQAEKAGDGDPTQPPTPTLARNGPWFLCTVPHSKKLGKL